MSARCVVALCGIFVAFATPVSAQSAGLALHRLRLQGDAGCETGSARYCPDQARFESLAGDIGVAAAGLPTSPAHTGGRQAFRVTARATMTPVRSDAWRRGTRGADASALENDDPPTRVSVLLAEVEKSLPLGFAVRGAAGAWVGSGGVVLGGGLRWAVLEGFRRGVFRYIPDISLSADIATVVGLQSLRVLMPSTTLRMSKRVIIARQVELTPMLGVSLLWVRASASGAVDLTPERDAVAECAPDELGECTGDGTDLNNNVTFATTTSLRARLTLGAALRYRAASLDASVAFDLARPADASRLVQVSLGVGLSF